MPMSYDPDNPYASFPEPNPGQPPQQPSGPIPQGTVPNYLVFSILSLVCCGGVFAIPALIYSTQVDNKLAAGDYDGAVEASEKAKMWVIIAVALGVICGGLLTVIQVFAIMAEAGR